MNTSHALNTGNYRPGFQHTLLIQATPQTEDGPSIQARFCNLLPVNHSAALDSSSSIAKQELVFGYDNNDDVNDKDAEIQMSCYTFVWQLLASNSICSQAVTPYKGFIFVHFAVCIVIGV